MTATNHALTGATIALALHGSWLAVPLAFASHFVLDGMPHYGDGKGFELVKTVKFKNILIIDITFCVIFALSIMLSQQVNWFVVVLSAFVATSPDFMWLPDFIAIKHHKKRKLLAERSWLVHLHSWVQWYQKPQGAYVEIVWFGMMITLLIHFLR